MILSNVTGKVNQIENNRITFLSLKVVLYDTEFWILKLGKLDQSCYKSQKKFNGTKLKLNVHYGRSVTRCDQNTPRVLQPQCTCKYEWKKRNARKKSISRQIHTRFCSQRTSHCEYLKCSSFALNVGIFPFVGCVCKTKPAGITLLFLKHERRVHFFFSLRARETHKQTVWMFEFFF